MTTRGITFFFDKEPGKLDLNFNEARLRSNEARLSSEMAAGDISSGVSAVFEKLIKFNQPKYEGPLRKLSSFSFTLENPDSEKRSITIEAADYSYSLTLTKVSEKTATLFMDSIVLPKTSK